MFLFFLYGLGLGLGLRLLVFGRYRETGDGGVDTGEFFRHGVGLVVY